MKIFISIIFLLLCVGLMGVILVQHRKSGGFSGNFGGGGTQMDVSGGSWQRMSLLTKVTVAMAAGFMVLSILLVRL
ncbi:MAG: preprotein translocase subunit SecG [Synergistaceae bacterium]|nr:preprotein translocase subunit SecG [Synergistaceae bacterium]